MSSRQAPTKQLAEKWRRSTVSEDETTCRICNCEFVEARTLPCMHSFCEGCIYTLLKSYQEHKKLDRTFRCPTCNVLTPCHIPGSRPIHSKWLEMFPKKIVIDKLKEAVIVVDEMCSQCSKSWTIVPATKFCVDCKDYLCEPCGTDHVTKMKHNHVVAYEVQKMKNTPVANISKFQCKEHNSLRYSSFCEVHQVYLCNLCKETGQHRHCRLSHHVIDATGNITKAETTLNVINSLKRDERSKGKQLMKLVEQIDAIQDKLETLRNSQIDAYCKYAVKASITEQQTEAIDALKGKLEFVKVHQTHEIINNTMTTVEGILSRYSKMVTEATDAEEKATRTDIYKGIADIEKILNRPTFASHLVNESSKKTSDNTKPTNHVVVKPDKQRIRTDTEKCKYKTGDGVTDSEDTLHVCKRHVDDTLDEETFLTLGGVFKSVGAIRYGKMSATAFRVGTKYVMTTAHTVHDIVDAERTGRPEWALLEDPDVYLSFASPLAQERDSNRFHLRQHVTFLDNELDVAILEIQETSVTLPLPVVLSRKDITDTKVNDVALISYGHRESRSKHLDTKCALVKPDSERAKQAIEWLKREEIHHRCNRFAINKDVNTTNWHYDELNSTSHVAIDCCMEYRAHGAPVITNTGSSGAEVMAIVTHSLPDCYTDLPKTTQEGSVAYRFELAAKMSHLYQKLCIETRVVADDIFTTEKTYKFYDYDLDTEETPDCSTTLSFLSRTPRSDNVQSTFSDSATHRSSATSYH